MFDPNDFNANSEEYRVVQEVGKFLVVMYTILSILVAVNMLIAMMSKTYDIIRVSEHYR